MRLQALFIPFAACAALGAMAPAQAQNQDRVDCSEGEAATITVSACTAVIQSQGESRDNLVIARRNRGHAFWTLGDTARAMSDFEEAVRLDPNSAAALRDRGSASALLGNYDSALADLNGAIALNPGDRRAFQNRTLTHQFQGNYPNAIADFTQAIELGQPESELFNGRCWVRILWGRQLDVALDDCNEAIRIDPRNANALNSRAAIRFLLTDFEAAADDYAASLSLAPSMVGSLYGRGAARLRLGQLEPGQADISGAIARERGIAERYGAFGVRP